MGYLKYKGRHNHQCIYQKAGITINAFIRNAVARALGIVL